MFFVLNTSLYQLMGGVGCDWVEDSHNQNESRCPNGQTGHSLLACNQEFVFDKLLACNQDCDQVEDSYNLSNLGYLNGKTSQDPSSSLNIILPKN